ESSRKTVKKPSMAEVVCHQACVRIRRGGHDPPWRFSPARTPRDAAKATVSLLPAGPPHRERCVAQRARPPQCLRRPHTVPERSIVRPHRLRRLSSAAEFAISPQNSAFDENGVAYVSVRGYSAGMGTAEVSARRGKTKVTASRTCPDLPRTCPAPALTCTGRPGCTREPVRGRWSMVDQRLSEYRKKRSGSGSGEPSGTGEPSGSSQSSGSGRSKGHDRPVF